ncbi:hypothetical protein [Flagellimonas pacifica]|uniref:Uncharacterized protein n=1 Tax=Flagellimonas pacifica TaxID=1247520 RepID=A0A285MD07_9FLAO|nr:hypothetical protein [Allomuricauda parva]SNY95019.1 hypothetical protein SAMN06265377_0685 [Allomuricauda parva]
MAEQPVNQNTSDEIDLGQLFQMIGRGFNKIGIVFLRIFLYLKKNALILGGLIIVGFGIGYGLNKITTKKKKIEVIVKPNFESKDYLYGAVQELEGKLKGKDTVFFRGLGINLEDLKKFEVEIAPMKDNGGKSNLEEDLKYLEYIGDLKNDGPIKQVIKNEVLSSSFVNHKIAFYFKNALEGEKAAHIIMDYINANPQFKELGNIYTNNAKEQIKENKILIDQIDKLVTNYTKALGNKSNGVDADGTVLLGGEQGLNIPALLSQKKSLVKNNAEAKIDLEEMKETIKILNFGKPQEIEKSFFGKSIVLIPLVLFLLFFIISAIRYLNKKASELPT